MTPSRLGDVLAALATVVSARAASDDDASYTARLLRAGPERIAKKVGEEGVETALAGALGDQRALREESADLLYHLMVLWAASDVTPDEVAGVLEGRFGQSGLAEKAARADVGGGQG